MTIVTLSKQLTRYGITAYKRFQKQWHAYNVDQL
jgi:hypothetical protein